jgi:hypothetical protein
MFYAGPSLNGAAQESNLPSVGLPRLTGFEELIKAGRQPHGSRDCDELRPCARHPVRRSRR